MKRIVLTTLIIVVLGVLLFGYTRTNKYTMEGTITLVANEHWVMVETVDGNVWEFDGYGYFEGEKVTVTLDSQDTPNKRDDKINTIIPIIL